MNDPFDSLRNLLSDNSDLASMDPEKAAIAAAKRKSALDRMDAVMEISDHVTNIIKAREFTITGDTSHLSVKHIVGQGANIDQPKKYEWQDDDENEQSFLRSIGYMLPGGLYGIGDATAEEFRAAVAGTGTVTLTGSRDTKCYDCAKPMRLSVNGKNLHLDCETACENNSEFFVDVDFPTGQVVYADWPDRFSEIRDEGFLDECDDGESINYIKGQRQRSEGFAAQGIFHLSVGNSCPTWYYNESTHAIIVGNENYDEEQDEYVIPEGFKEMGSFCTDLWWVTMLDMSRYEEMVSKLPGERNKGYYTKDVETATIKPGRYRFYAVPPKDSDDDGSRVYSKAEYLGPCGEIPKVKSVAEGKVMLTPRQMVIQSAKRYPSMYRGQFEEVRFKVMDHIFNVLGNGIRSKGEFLSHISVPAGTDISDEMPPETGEMTKWDKEYVRTPYPNFSKQYSLLGRDVPLEVLSVEWLEEAVWFYTECQKFFNGPTANHYSYAYPNAKPRPSDAESWAKAMDERRAKTKSEEEFAALVKKDYGVEWRGDMEDFLVRRWAKELKKVTDFIAETLNTLHAELTSRKSAG